MIDSQIVDHVCAANFLEGLFCVQLLICCQNVDHWSLHNVARIIIDIGLDVGERFLTIHNRHIQVENDHLKVVHRV